MDFFLFVLVTGVMFVRPTDFVPGLAGVPLYQVLIVSCMLVSWNRLASRLTSNAFREDPTAVMVVGILLVSLVSNLAHGDLETALDFGTDFGKIVLFYLLLVGVVDSPVRLRRFLACLVGFDLVPTILALLQYHGMINIPAFNVLEEGGVPRLHATGLFGDPNDFCEILNTAMLFSLYRLMHRGRGWSRLLWLAPIPVLGLALSLTQSRGGFLGTMAGLLVLFWARYGRRKTIMLAAVALPVMLFLLSGRQTSLSTSEGTSQQRIQLWIEGFTMLKQSPIWGIGTGRFVERLGYVAHNSFVHAYAELGLLGGTLFFGMYYRDLTSLARLGSTTKRIRDPEIRHARPYIMAAVASCAVSQMSLSRCYGVPTYAILGIGAVCIRLAAADTSFDDPQPDRRLASRVIRASLIFLVSLYVFAKLTVRW